MVQKKLFLLLIGMGVGFSLSARASTCASTPAGLLGWWAGENNANDVYRVHNGSLQNGATYAPGIVGTSFSLDGVDDYVDLGAWTPGATWTCEAWINASSTNAGRKMILGGANSCRDWGIVVNDGELGEVSRPPGGCSQIFGSGVMVVTGTWYHVVGTCDGTTAKIYVNGQLRNAGTVESSYTAYEGGMRIGGEACCTGDNFAGLVDEVTLYSRALTDAEVASIYNAGSAGKCTIPAGGVPYFTDFESGIGPEWVYASVDGSEPRFTRFTGRFGNQAQLLVLNNLVIGQSVHARLRSRHHRQLGRRFQRLFQCRRRWLPAVPLQLRQLQRQPPEQFPDLSRSARRRTLRIRLQSLVCRFHLPRRAVELRGLQRLHRD